MNDRLIIFTRYPEPGKVKSRLIPELGAEGASELQREMTAHTFDWAAEIRDVDVEVRFEGGTGQLMQDRFLAPFPFRRQIDGDLGRRMADAFAAAFAEGVPRAAIIGTDCPDVDRRLVKKSLRLLADHDVVLGPAVDGGYYLIALRRHVPELLQSIAWGTSQVLSQTIQTAERLHLSVAQLRPLADVDRPEDVAIWERVKQSPPGGTGRLSARVGATPVCTGRRSARGTRAPRISIIIPTLNESTSLPVALSAISEANVEASAIEVIVVDGGSTDETMEIAKAHGTRTLTTRPNRACQMNTGAAVAAGDIFLFLHADTRLTKRFDERVCRSLARQAVVAGAFQLRIEGAGLSLRLIERAANLRSRLFQMPYGDQAIFVGRETFNTLGGFPEQPIMEDYEFVRQLRRCGHIAIVNAEVVTSGRRWQTLGPWKTTWINQMIVFGYHLGYPADQVAKWYRTEQT